MDALRVSYSNHTIAESFAGFGIPAFAYSPDKFPYLMAAAIACRDLEKF
ncbi:hypothetical protein [Calothrix rhizosoleniae]|nr:hypothetical protein [Calothrix rhizosoleniae]